MMCVSGPGSQQTRGRAGGQEQGGSWCCPDNSPLIRAHSRPARCKDPYLILSGFKWLFSGSPSPHRSTSLSCSCWAPFCTVSHLSELPPSLCLHSSEIPLWAQLTLQREARERRPGLLGGVCLPGSLGRRAGSSRLRQGPILTSLGLPPSAFPWGPPW